MAAPIVDVVAANADDPFWRRAGRWLLLSGLISGCAASAIGLVDYLAIKQVRRLPSAHVHAGGNAVALALTAVNLARRDPHDRQAPDSLDLALSVGVVCLLGVTAWLGGELSYRHGVGVIAEDSSTASEDLARLAAGAADRRRPA